ncbi:bifunctional phosphopantothenoylcysteine decarboxylase/phosphopantothenate--cysteine ligase CoaBC [Fervidibacillus halotolerans]|uniref:Coenzyme A biosynthesis bifunctional protein CoaBC n=1 Tax=Fervidibacillus halotolerans TaxID=2980027 RepID=A0A9E8M1V9_9BACI|nr:bifunctional phosphopantothenoylcysteine decarboxylase/phosphopantothenate--cysteine ligase CoaBC [Fervidibacillus halotolerans]WAA13656.1 bifunctional phosphopantothenoylcysteine decarboxylase/phosphopantothenate--cysteine ligase CoaBC [Fervidibacillus halotolerans]
MERKKILLCVTGGIAVYKSVALASKLTQNGFQVKVMMSENATKFVTPLSFQAISRNEVYIDTFDEKDPAKIAHIDLVDWPDLILIAPATANIIGKLANGIADDLISTSLLAATKPIMIAPSMNVHMYEHPAVQKNMETLKRYGYRFIEPNEGYLACGYIGKGRLEEPERITEIVIDVFKEQDRYDHFLFGKKVLITAGPTREKLDPVRYISNFSTGKMGYSLAKVAASLGADVTLISGPVSLPEPDDVQIVKVESAEEMFDASVQYFDRTDIAIMTAAVADYRPVNVASKKLKKHDDLMTIQLEKTKDILYELGKRKKHQFVVGFAAETDQLEENAKKKLYKKNVDMIVGNNVLEAGAGFGTDTNIVTIFKRSGDRIPLPKMTKEELSYRILKEIEKELKGEENENC